MDVSRLCAALVAIKSENPPGDTADIIEYIRDYLDARGIPAFVIDTGSGRSNLVTRNPKKKLLFCGHVDVVPAGDGWTHLPYAGVIEDGSVWGRGATDMKGGCAAMLAACDSLVQEGRELPADLAFVCDEEAGGDHGIRHLLRENLLFPCDCLIAEPTPARHPCIGQKGLCRITVDFTGTPGHGSLYPVVGVNAIMEAMGFLTYVKSLSDRRYPFDGNLQKLVTASSGVFSDEFHIPEGSMILEQITFNPGVITGGEKVNIIARHCTLGFEMRIPWGCSIPELVREIRGHAPNGTVTVETTSDPTLTDPEGDFTSIVSREVEKVWGGAVFPILQWAASDARHLRRAGFNVIEYGPGEISTLHGIDERVSVASLEKAVRIYRGILDAYSSRKSTV
jgi:succinyl-diaminopimelate desuccinylase